MRKSILLPFLLPAIGFAAVKGYYWYQVKTVVDDAIAKMAPFATVEYQGIETSFEGAAGVTGLRVTPTMFGQTLEIDAVRVTAPSWTYFLEARGQLEQGVFPEHLGLEVDGFVIDFTSPLFSQWEQLEGANDALLGCEKANISGATFMKALGYSRVSTNLRLSYEFNPLSEFLTYEVAASVDEDGSRFVTSADIDLGVSELTRARLVGVQPRFGGLEVTYQDHKFNQARNAYCAEANGEPVLAFVNRHVDLLAARYRDLGLQFSDALVEGYRQFLTGNGEMKVSLRAANPIGFDTLALYSPNNFIEALDIQVQMNGKKIEPLDLAWQPPASAADETLAAAGQATEADSEAVAMEAEAAVAAAGELEAAMTESSPPADDGAQAESKPMPVKAEAVAPTTEEFMATAFKPQPKPKPEYRSVAFDRLKRHDGARVKLLTHNGRVIDGELVVADNGKLRLRRKVGNGTAILPVITSRLSEVQVLY